MAPPAKIERDPAKFAFAANHPSDRIAPGTTETIVRAYRMPEGGSLKDRTEVVGAKCTLVSDHIQAEVVTPQVVVLPKYDQDKDHADRGVPPSIVVTCDTGEARGQALLAAKPGKVMTGNSGHLFVDLVVLAGSAAVASTANWRYQPLLEVYVK